MYYLILVLHIIVSVGLILIVLLQAGKGSGIAGLFGGGGSDQFFSAPSGMAFIKKVTVVMAVVFVLTSLLLTMITSRIGMRSVTSQIPMIPVAPQGAPQAPGQ
ncbi:MAG: preprotein translocase subunit SecG [Endomicrobiales bacterium]|nr:preprotein translocase subunit SecG [Endomicrobiales bacterium]